MSLTGLVSFRFSSLADSSPSEDCVTAPKLKFSLRCNEMLGAAFDDTALGDHNGVDSLAVSLITPPNVRSGGGSCLPLMVVAASGEPGVPVICWATDDSVVSAN